MAKKKKKVKKKGRKSNRNIPLEKVYDYNKFSKAIEEVQDSIEDIFDSDISENLDSNGYKVLCNIFNRIEGIIYGVSIALEEMEQDPHYTMSENIVKNLKGLIR